MFRRSLAASASLLVIAACTTAEARQETVHQDGNHRLVINGHEVSVGEQRHIRIHREAEHGLSHEEALQFRLEINEEVRAELAGAREEVQRALEEARQQLEELGDLEIHIEGHPGGQFDGKELEQTILFRVEQALADVDRSFGGAEAYLDRGRNRMMREAERMEQRALRMQHEAERMEQRAASLETKSQRMQAEAERMREEAWRWTEAEKAGQPDQPAKGVMPKAPSRPEAPADAAAAPMPLKPDRRSDAGDFGTRASAAPVAPRHAIASAVL